MCFSYDPNGVTGSGNVNIRLLLPLGKYESATSVGYGMIVGTHIHGFPIEENENSISNQPANTAAVHVMLLRQGFVIVKKGSLLIPVVTYTNSIGYKSF